MTAKARHSIRQYLKKLRRDEAIELGRRLLVQAMRARGTSIRRISRNRMNQLLKDFELDKQIDSMLEQKKQMAAAVLADGPGTKSDSAAAPKLSIFQMLKSILPESNPRMRQTSILQFSQDMGEKTG